jgi:hypothetical protein
MFRSLGRFNDFSENVFLIELRDFINTFLFRLDVPIFALITPFAAALCKKGAEHLISAIC